MKLSALLTRTRFVNIVICLVVAFWLLGPGASGGGLSVSGVYAADEDETAEKKDEAKTSGTKEKPSLFVHMFKSVGWVFGPVLAIVSVSLIALVVLLSMDLRMGTTVPPDFVEEFTDIVNKRRFKEAYELARNDGSALGRVMTTGMGRLQYGIEDAREAAFNMVDSIRASKEQLIAYLATIGTLGPLLGLVGTVFGMILAFLDLATKDYIDPQALADAISHALVVTLFGVALSVPAIFFHTFFRNRVIRLSMDTGNVADDLLTQMYHNSKKPAGPDRPLSTPEVAAGPDRGGPSAAIKPK